MTTPRRGLPLALLLALGCAVGPDYQEPATKTDGAYAGAATSGVSQDPVVVEWWRQFGDPLLDRLIDRAIEGNRDVRTAASLLREARALYDQEQFDLIPTVTARAGYERDLASRTVLPNTARADRELGSWSAGFDAFWELDLFGRIRRSNEAAEAEVGAVEASRRDVLVTLLAEVARNYFEYRGARARLDVTRRNELNQEQSLKFVTARYEGGKGTDLDVSRARAELQSTKALLPPLEAEAERAKNRLAVLLGAQPSAFALAIGRPEDLLRRRPDIRRAERALAASTARIGVATADLFPRLTFGGTFGTQAATVPALFQAGGAAYAFGPSLTWAFLDLGRVSARIRASDARAEADLHRYEQTVLLALEETENALTQVGRTRERRDALIEAVAASERAAELADARYQAGAVDFLSSLDAQRQVLSFQLQLSESRTRTLTSLIALYKALGGGWAYAPEKKVGE
jgi:multidrug efflux system outer membrane protein